MNEQGVGSGAIIETPTVWLHLLVLTILLAVPPWITSGAIASNNTALYPVHAPSAWTVSQYDNATRDIDWLLKSAAKHGKVDHVRDLVNMGAEINSVDSTGTTALLLAADGGSLDVVKFLLSRGADPSIQNTFGITPLFVAARNGHYSVVEVLLKRANPDVGANDGFTPLIMAAQQGHGEVVRLLLDGGANPNIATHEKNTALKLATHRGHASIVKRLLAHGADPNIKNTRGRTALMAAANEGHAETLKVLIAGGADPNAKDGLGFTPLIFSAQRGNMEVARLLLSAGANANAETDKGSTALRFAAQEGHPHLVREFVRHGIDPDAVNKHGFSPLMSAAHTGNLGMAETLLLNRASPNAHNSDGLSPLALAMDNNDNQMIQLLRAHGASASIENSARQKNAEHALMPSTDIGGDSGEARLMYAAWTGDIGLADALLRRGVDPNTKDEEGQTALMIAAWAGNPNIIKLLIGAGSNPDLRDRIGNTALIWAAMRGNMQAASELVGARANIDARGPGGSTALMHAISSGHFDIARLLIGAGADPNIAMSGPPTDVGTTPLLHVAVVGSDDYATIRNEAGVLTQTATPDGAARVAEMLLKAGADPNAINAMGVTPLYMASAHGNARIVKLLIAAGAKPDSKATMRFFPVAAAASGGYPEVVELLLSASKESELSSAQNRQALMAVVPAGSQGLGRILRREGMSARLNFDARTISGKSVPTIGESKLRSSLIDAWANKEGANDEEGARITQLLLDAGVDPDTQLANGATVLMLAAYFGRLRIMDVLLKAGADPNEVTNENLTALMHVIFRHNPEFTRVLLKTASAGDRDKELGGARLPQQEEFPVSEMLSSVGSGMFHARADIRATYDGEDTALAKLLIENGASPNVQFDGVSALMAVVRRGDANLTRLILDAGGDPDFAASDGRTALMDAAERTRADIAELLLNSGADPDIVSDDGTTALRIAREKGDARLVDLLEAGKEKSAWFSEMAGPGDKSLHASLIGIGLAFLSLCLWEFAWNGRTRSGKRRVSVLAAYLAYGLDVAWDAAGRIFRFLWVALRVALYVGLAYVVIRFAFLLVSDFDRYSPYLVKFAILFGFGAVVHEFFKGKK